GVATATPAANPPPPDLHAQLLAAARDPDDRLVLARAYAVNKLAELPDAQVTAELVEMCGEAKAPEAVRIAACTRLANREQGEAEILAALRRRGSFLENTP